MLLKDFLFHGQLYQYIADAPDERAVEISIMLRVIERYKNRQRTVLEYGHVVEYYQKAFPTYQALDERQLLCAEGQFDLVVSVLDDSEGTFDSIFKVLDKMLEITRPGGEVLLMVPRGQNESLDLMLDEDRLSFERYYMIKRLPGVWEECDWVQAKEAKRDAHFRGVNSIIILHKLIKGGFIPLGSGRGF